MTVLVLQNNCLDRIGRLIVPCLEFCARNGLEFVDRSLTDNLDVDALDLDDSRGLVVYGSVGWMKRFKGSRYGDWIDYAPEAFAASKWVPLFGDRAFNRAGKLMSAGEVTELLAAGGECHLRPDRDDKAFTGGIYDAQSWANMLQERGVALGGDVLSIPCWLSPKRDIAGEIRCWFVGGETVEASYYRKDGEHVRERVRDMGLIGTAAALGEIYLPCDNVVLDIALHEGDVSVLEFNPIHSSGWYAADVDRILGAWVGEIGRRLDRTSQPSASLSPILP